MARSYSPREPGMLPNMVNRQRPPAVTWLAGSVFLLGIANLSIVVTGVMRRYAFETLQLSVALPILMVLGGFWTVAWIGTAWGLFHLKRWSRIAVPVLFAIYEVVNIGRQAIFSQEAYSRGRLGFVVILDILLLGIMSLILTRPRVRVAFGRS